MSDLTDADLGLDLLGPSNAGLQQRSYKNLDIQNASREVNKVKKLERQQMSMRKIPKSDTTGQKIITVRLEFDKMKQKAEELSKEVEKMTSNGERTQNECNLKLSSLKEQIEQVKSALTIEKQSVEAQSAKLKSENDAIVSELHENLAREQEELNLLNGEIESITNSLTSTEKVEETTEDRKNREVLELEEADGRYQAKIKTIHTKNNILNDTLAKNVELLGKLQDQDSIQMEDGSKNQELEVLKASHTSLQSQLDEWEQKTKNLKNEISTNEVQLGELSKKLLTTKTTKKMAQEEFDTYQSQLEKISNPVVVKSEPEYLVKLKNNDTTLVELKLSNKGVTDADVTQISLALKKNTHLKVLDLSNNSKVTGETMIAVINMIKTNATLEELNFEKCPVTRKALDLLLANLEHNTTLTQVFGGLNETDNDIEKIDQIMDRNVDLANN
jgi:DNA repair exonuclease SbcCD ATPase subunit